MEEPKLTKKEFINNKIINNQKKVIIASFICMLLLGISSSYAILTNFSKTDEIITFKTGNLEATILNGEDIFDLINLNNKYPESDSEGLKNATVIPIIIKNTGTITIGTYHVKLISDDISTIDSKYIKYSISLDNVTYKSSKYLENNNIIYTGNNLEVDNTKTIYLKIWLADDSGNNVLGKMFSGTIMVDLYQQSSSSINFIDTIKEELVPYQTSSSTDFSGGLVGINSNGLLYNETDTTQTIREYRYSGANANNYVYFDTNGNNEKDDNEIYRIIGIFKDEEGLEHIKLVRNIILTTDEIPKEFVINSYTYSIDTYEKNPEDEWHSPGHAYWNGVGENANDWTSAGLQYFLNRESDDEGTGGYLGSFTKKASSLIDKSYTYYLGNYMVDTTTLDCYANERNATNIWEGNQATWNSGNGIGLMYPSDYGYSALSTYWSDTSIDDYYTTKANTTSWMYNTIGIKSFEWLISPTIGDDYAKNTGVARLTGIGTINLLSCVAMYPMDFVRPSFYLISEIEILDNNATGEIDNPYVINQFEFDSVTINYTDSYTASSNVNLTLSSSNAKYMCISNTEECTSYEEFTNNKNWTLTSGDGLKTVYAYFKDENGNISSVVTDTIILDITNPVISNLTDAKTRTITFTTSDKTSGPEKYCINKNATDTSNCTWFLAYTENMIDTKSVTEDNTYYVHLSDKAGNIAHSNGLYVTIGQTVNFDFGTLTGLTAINTNGTLYDSSDSTQTIREYRYSGAIANNYIKFNNEIWRIVGVFKNSSGNWNLKLTRNIYLTNEELPTTYTYNSTTFTIRTDSNRHVYWNSTQTSTNQNDWTTAGLQYYLNGEDGYYGTLSTTAKAMIDPNYVYYLGGPSTSDTTIVAYTKERDTSNVYTGNYGTWTGSVALLYPSDFGYSSSAIYWDNVKLNNYSYSTYFYPYQRSWFQKTLNSSDEWTISAAINSTNVLYFGSSLSTISLTYKYVYARPVVNLLSTVKIASGDGTEKNPYILQ